MFWMSALVVLRMFALVVLRMFALIKFRLPQSQIANVEEDPGDAEISPKVLD